MVIKTKYDIGDTVMFRNYRACERSVIEGEIVRITVRKGGTIRYTIQYLLDGEWLTADVWEDDLPAQN